MPAAHRVFQVITAAVVAVIIVNLIFVPKIHWTGQLANIEDREIQTIALLNETLTALHNELYSLKQKRLAAREPAENKKPPVPHSENKEPHGATASSIPNQGIADTPPAERAAASTGEVRKPVSVTPSASKPTGIRAVIFTMDSIASYEKNSLAGGAAGELTVRRSLEFALRHFGAHVTVLKSDAEFNNFKLDGYDIIILDPWTWAAKGWVPKRNLVGHESKVYILDFFGSRGLRNGGMKIPLDRFLTAFGSADNTFLGYYMENSSAASHASALGPKTKLKRGVVWGKDFKHFHGKEKLVRALAQDVKLASTSTRKVFHHENMQWLGHQSAERWMQLLRESRFLLGLGNPILGPSALDAISVGCMFFNPVYEKPVVVNGLKFKSQHPYAEKLGLPYVCNYRENSLPDLRACLQRALQSELQPVIPADFTLLSYLLRVQKIFSL